MLDISLIPILGVLGLIGLTVFVTNRRAAKVAEARVDVELKREQILRDDRRNDEALIEHILEGVSTDQAVTVFLGRRAEMLPGANPESPAAWTLAQFEDGCREELRRRVDLVNRSLLVPAFVTAIVVVAVCVVSTVVLYQFRSQPADDVDVTANP